MRNTNIRESNEFKIFAKIESSGFAISKVIAATNQWEAALIFDEHMQDEFHKSYSEREYIIEDVIQVH